MNGEKTNLKNQPTARESYSLPKTEQQKLEEIQNKFSGFKPVIRKSEIVRIGIHKVNQIEENEAKKILEELGRRTVGKQTKDKGAEGQTGLEITVSNRQWDAVAKIFPTSGKAEGRPKAEHRRVLDSIFYIFRNEIQRRKVPDNYSSYATARRRLNDWKKQDLWRSICNALINNANKDQQIELQRILLRTWLIETERKIK